MKRKVITVLVSIVFFLGIVACSGSYMIKDPTGGSTYYTKKIKKERDGTIIFNDAVTGSKVTLKSSEVKKISSKEYKEAVKK